MPAEPCRASDWARSGSVQEGFDDHADVCSVAARYSAYVTRASTAALLSTDRFVLTVRLLALVRAKAPIVVVALPGSPVPAC